MLPAARVTDLIVSTATSGIPTPIIPPGAPTVLIGGLPAARMGDTCGVDAIVKGSATVLIGGLPAARVRPIPEVEHHAALAKLQHHVLNIVERGGAGINLCSEERSGEGCVCVLRARVEHGHAKAG